MAKRDYREYEKYREMQAVRSKFAPPLENPLERRKQEQARQQTPEEVQRTRKQRELEERQHAREMQAIRSKYAAPVEQHPAQRQHATRQPGTYDARRQQVDDHRASQPRDARQRQAAERQSQSYMQPDSRMRPDAQGLDRYGRQAQTQHVQNRAYDERARMQDSQDARPLQSQRTRQQAQPAQHREASRQYDVQRQQTAGAHETARQHSPRQPGVAEDEERPRLSDEEYRQQWAQRVQQARQQPMRPSSQQAQQRPFAEQHVSRREGQPARQPMRDRQTGRSRLSQQLAGQQLMQEPAVQSSRQNLAEFEGFDAPEVAAWEQAQRSPSRTSVAGRHAHDPYTSNYQYRAAVSQPGTHTVQGKYDRRPMIDKPADHSKSLLGRLPNISLKYVGIAAVILVVVIALIVINPFGAKGDDVQTGGSGTPVAASAGPSTPTPIMSESSGVTMHSAVAMEDLSEILIHNASYAYANEITTQLKEATNTEVIAAHGTGRIASEQPTGDNWMTGEFIRCFREGNAGPVMSAIDCGGPVGATVYAPVTGEVVLVRQYKLYGEIDDYEIHIQPTGRPDLDVVLIHLTDVTVQAGDQVTAGVTPIAKIRDIFQYLDESLQLKNYTAADDNGNHTHIQVNNATHPEYHGLDALKPDPAPEAATTPDSTSIADA